MCESDSVVAGNMITEYVFAFCAIRATYTELNLVGVHEMARPIGVNVAI